jgi:hypothetical protein
MEKPAAQMHSGLPKHSAACGRCHSLSIEAQHRKVQADGL